YENPTALVVWEAQFGDFANTAQVMTDQFISAGEHKWLQQTGLVMLLPHGYMGQGAEHSSCRIERFLQSSDDDEDDIPDFKDGFGRRQAQKANWQVMNLSTPANYFHALRRQQHRDFRKPMVVASPKNLFRLRQCVSPISDMEADTRFQRLIGERDPEIAGNPDKVERLIFCSGKIYYELVAERERLGLKNVAIVTIEQLAPFPFDRVKQVMATYKNVDAGDGVHPGQFVWCQATCKDEEGCSDILSPYVLEPGPLSALHWGFLPEGMPGLREANVVAQPALPSEQAKNPSYPKLWAPRGAQQLRPHRQSPLDTSPTVGLAELFAELQPPPVLGRRHASAVCPRPLHRAVPAMWDMLPSPVARPSCHAPSPTEKCPSCHRYVACSGLQAHVQRCQKLSRRFEEMQRHPTLLGSRASSDKASATPKTSSQAQS
ncbi:ogdh, partial [Symbiodinium necroappetens]